MSKKPKIPTGTFKLPTPEYNYSDMIKLKMVSGSLDQKTALDLIFNFLNEPDLSPISKNALGGTFAIGDFNLKPSYYAKQFWYCLEGAMTATPKVYLAMEDSMWNWPKNISSDDCPLKPETAWLKRPASTFSFDDGNFDRSKIASVEKFILQTTGKPQPATQMPDKDVLKYAWAFASFFAPNADSYCEYPYAYFEDHEVGTTTNWIQEFLGQCKPGVVKGVRYFFGLDNFADASGYRSAPNRIRLIFFLVDLNGDLILQKITDGSDNGDETLMLEKSFPPPPPL